MNTKQFSSRQEKMVADLLGGTVVRGSGSRPLAPGDVRAGNWLCECKTHVTPDTKVTFMYDVYDKLMKESLFAHRSPLLVVDDGSQDPKNTWCIFPPAAINQDCADSVGFGPAEYRTSKSISFDNVAMMYDYNQECKGHDKPVVWLVHWKRYFVNMCPLLKLIEICEADI